MNVLAGPLPRHHYVLVDSRFTHHEPCGFLPAVWFGLVSIPGRAWGCNVMLESGAVYRALPPHAIAFRLDPVPWTVEQAQAWDCYGTGFSCLEYPYLAGLDCMARAGDENVTGSYLFTAVPVGDGFSAYPEQAKEFMFVRTDGGRLTIQPTDRVVFRDRSFTGDDLAWPRGLRRSTEVYSCE